MKKNKKIVQESIEEKIKETKEKNQEKYMGGIYGNNVNGFIALFR
ncbi:MAG: hypothetical protein WCR97_00090 [Bacilli bacterium]